MRRKPLLLAIISSVGIAFLLPLLIVNLLHLMKVLPPQSTSGTAIPLPNNIFSFIFVMYFLFPRPFLILIVISALLYQKLKVYFKKVLGS